LLENIIFINLQTLYPEGGGNYYSLNFHLLNC
jgi:hypothetical protein